MHIGRGSSFIDKQKPGIEAKLGLKECPDLTSENSRPLEILTAGQVFITSVVRGRGEPLPTPVIHMW